jgi:hypothetical protein
VKIHTDPQRSEAWLESRRGVITGSRAKDARDRSNGLTAQQSTYVEALRAGRGEGEAMASAGYKKKPTAEAVDKALAGTLEMVWGAKAILYAQDVARERCGGTAAAVFVNGAMLFGSEQEPFARIADETQSGDMIEEAGFIVTDDKRFGVSVDGLIGADGVWECKTMVSSDTLFTAVVDGDVRAYIDQINFALWLLGRKWCRLALWAPDLPAKKLTTIVIERDDNAIEALESDLIAFEKLVSSYETKLRRAMGQQTAPAPSADEALKASILARSPAIGSQTGVISAARHAVR